MNLLLWRCVDNGEELVDPLRDSRVIETMRTLDMERWCVAPWSFGQQDEEKHGVKTSCCIGTNTQAQFITLDGEDLKVSAVVTTCTPQIAVRKPLYTGRL